MNFEVINKLKLESYISEIFLSITNEYLLLFNFQNLLVNQINGFTIPNIEKNYLVFLIEEFKDIFARIKKKNAKVILFIQENNISIEDWQNDITNNTKTENYFEEFINNNLNVLFSYSQNSPHIIQRNNHKSTSTEDSTNNTLSVSEKKELLFSLLKEELNTEQYQHISEAINSIEEKRIENISKSSYDIYLQHFTKKKSYESFERYLHSTEEKIERDKQYFSTALKSIDNKDIEKSRFIIEKYQLLKKFLQANADFYEINHENITDLSMSLIGNLHYELLTLRTIEEKIPILKDVLNLNSLYKNNNYEVYQLPKSIKIFSQKGHSIELNSPTLTNKTLRILSDYASLYTQFYSCNKTVKEQIVELELFAKRFQHITIRKIALQLISNNIMTTISNKGNKYGLYNRSGDLIELRRKEAILIYDIAEAIGLDIKKSKGIDKGQKAEYYDKTDLIKERLETAARIKDIILPSPYEDYIELL